MAAYYGNSQNLVNKFPIINMEAATADTGSLDLCNASPPDFDFELPCRFFKSSFARSLSLNNASSQCKSLDYDMRCNNSNNNNSNNYNKTSFLKRETKVVPPIPQRRGSQAGSFYPQPTTLNEANKNEIASNNEMEDQPPALPARRPLSLHNTTQLGHNLSVKNHCYINNTNDQCQLNAEQKPKDALLTHLRPQQYTTNNSNNSNNNNENNNKNIINQATGLQAQTQSLHIHHHHHHQQQQHQQPEYQMQFPIVANDVCNTHTNSSSNSGNSVCVNNNNNTSNTNDNNMFRSNNIVWPPQQQKNVEQDCNIYNNDHTDEDDNTAGIDLISNYRDTTKLSSNNDYNSHSFPNSHQMITATMMPTINVHNNQQQQQQHQQQQQNLPSYNEILNDNTTNVEAVILQNQVDTLQWQLKRVETSCDMYRAVMEEVARFLERYQSQKQLQQQQQQQKHQEYQVQQTVAVHKQKSNNSKVEQIPRSKSLFQVYIAGGHDKSTSGCGGSGSNSALDEATSSYSPTASSSSLSYLRARSSTNLIDLKHQQNVDDTSSNKKKLIGHSKDDHDYETGLKPSQSYSALKDLTWRRSPKKADLRLNTEEDLEEKLNQEAFRLLRTIQNLLNTSHHQPDLAQHRHSLAPSTTINMGRLSKTLSTTSVLTLPGAPLLNSTSLTIGSNSTGSCTPDSATASPSNTVIAHNTASNNLAPEMLFLRSANMRDSRLSLRSSTDSSVHSTSSAASSASSKVETDEEPSTIFRSPPNILAHKQQHHLTGSSTEDESGFSSINSFPDIGVPLNSTMLSSTASSTKNARIPNKEINSEMNDSCNSTLKANVVGLPLNASQDMSHRWDPPSKTYHNASSKFQRFSALMKEDSNTVLWV